MSDVVTEGMCWCCSAGVTVVVLQMFVRGCAADAFTTVRMCRRKKTTWNFCTGIMFAGVRVQSLGLGVVLGLTQKVQRALQKLCPFIRMIGSELCNCGAPVGTVCRDIFHG